MRKLLVVFLLLMSFARIDAKAIRDEYSGASVQPGAPAYQTAPSQTTPAPVAKDTLKGQYQDIFLVGNVVSPREIGTERFDLLKKHFDILTAENAMKPLYLQREKGVFTFEAADTLVDAVLAAGMQVHGHTLAWHQQSPEWINREGIGRDEAIKNLETHVTTVVEHFKGRVISWDVLNEAILDNPANAQDWRATLRKVPWYNAIGEEYIVMLFKAAREADPDAVLYYNDYNLDNHNKATAVYNMVKEINEKNPDVRGRPLIDGIGMQGHYRVGTNVDNVAASLKRFASLGVEVSITELDVQAGANYRITEEQALLQGAAYARLFALFRRNADVLRRVTIWGLDDGASWRSMTSPTLFDKDLKEKPAFFGALDPAAFLAQHEGAIDATKRDPLQTDARYGKPSLDAADPLWQTAKEIPINQYTMAWQGASGAARALWDEENLYVLITVNNAELNKANPAPYEQDSVEIFIDEGNHKAGYMQADDGQYRVNFDNEGSFTPESIETGFESQAVVSGKTYTVTARIPWKTIKPQEGAIIGFDLQINGASARGMRQSVTVWNDITGNAWQDPSLYGLLRLVR